MTKKQFIFIQNLMFSELVDSTKTIVAKFPNK